MIKTISDKERREVAQKLREVERLEWDGNVWCDEWNVLNALGLYNEDDPNSCNPDKVAYLAYLIDRPTCKNLATKPADELLCSECGEHVDIVYMENTNDYHAQFCPTCGTEISNGN